MASYTHRTVNAVLTVAEKEKKRKYTQAVRAYHASFPAFMSVGGVMGRDSWHGRPGLWCGASQTSYLPSGVSPIAKCWAGCEVNCTVVCHLAGY